ncbi:MAG: serine/threonine-protein kinase [Planctomycetota bacterium]
MTEPTWEQVRRIFLAALEAPAAERPELIERETAGDDALADEVRSLLGAHDEPSAVLRELAEDRAVGPYRLIAELGRGGMGTVHLAVRTDGEFLQRAAVKVLKRGMDTDEIVQRFLAERQALAALDHPYIARILDGGSTSAGRPYFAMEYVHGRPIDRYCDEEGLDVRARLTLFVKVCRAVAHAHQRLVVHRDIKPANVLVIDGDDGGEPVPKLLDFGIAKLLHAGRQASTVTAGAAAPWMTPEYASPEQAAGEPVGTATDVYSLGALLYRLLTGRTPFDAPPTEPRLPLAPSAVTPGGGIDRDLDTVVLHALEPDVVGRYSSVEEQAADVERYLRGLPVLARATGPLHRARLFVRRHTAAVAALAGVFLLLIVGLAVVSAQSAAARDEAAKAREVNDFVAWLLGLIDPANEGREVNFSAVVDLAAERVETEFSDRPEIRATLQDRIGSTNSRLGRYDVAEPLLVDALATRRQLLGDRAEETLASIEHLGELLYDRNDLERALPLAEEAVAGRERRGEPLALAGALNLLGLIQERNADYAEATRSLERAIELRREHLGPSEELVLSLNNLSLARSAQGRRNDARALAGEATVMMRRLFDRPHPTLATVLFNGGTYEYQAGNLERAYEMLSEAVDLRLEVLGDNHLDTGLAKGSLGAVASELGDLSYADELTEASVRLVCEADAESFVCASAQYDRAKLLAMLGKFDEAVEAYRVSLAIYLPLGQDHDAPATVESRIVGVLYDGGHYDEVHEAASKLFGRWVRANGKHLHPWYLPDIYTADGRAWLAQGELERARESLASAVAFGLGRRSWRAAWTWVGLADLAARDGDHESELRHAREALEVLDAKLPGPSVARSWVRLRLGRALWGAGEHEEAAELLKSSSAALEAALPASHPWLEVAAEWSEVAD